MWDYLPLIITAVLIAGALAWWLVSLNSVSKSDTLPKDVTPPKTVDAPPVAATPPSPVEKPVAKAEVTTAPLMDDPKPASKTAPAKAQAPLKAAATKAAPTTKAAPMASATKPAKPIATDATAKVAAPKIVVAKPAPAKVAAKPKTAAVAVPDNLGLLKGVGPKLTTLLQSLGITSFHQIANWTAADITEIDAKLGNFAGRIGRDNWVDQARLLSSGDTAGFEQKYGALGSETKKG